MFGRFNLSAAAILAAAAVGGAAALQPIAMSPSTPKHRRTGTGPGTKAFQRRAAKRRNVQRNRSAHRG